VRETGEERRVGLTSTRVHSKTIVAPIHLEASRNRDVDCFNLHYTTFSTPRGAFSHIVFITGIPVGDRPFLENAHISKAIFQN
jgi:hypothetical protein